MFFSAESCKQFLIVATTGWLCFVTSVISAAENAKNTLSIRSTANQPFIAELQLNQLSSNTDLSCFSLKSSLADAPMQLEYTTLGNSQGMLTIWSENIAETPFTLRLNNQCQHTSDVFYVDPANSIVTSAIVASKAPQIKPALANSEVAAPAQPVAAEPEIKQAEAVKSVAAQPLADTPSTVSSDISLNEQQFQLLQLQIRQLQIKFGQLQTQLETLYKVNLQQTHLVERMRTELTQEKSENHLLRILILCLGFVLLCSSYFFADWLRRHSATPRHTHRTSPHNQQTTAQDDQVKQTQTNTVITAAPANVSTDATSNTFITPSASISQLTKGRVQSLPRQANDDQAPLTQPSAEATPQSESVIQDATRYLTHGRINQAIQHLQNHLAQQPKCSPWVWLYLLDLLGREGKHQEFDLAASECRKHFNINVEREPDYVLHGIESFSRITKALQQAWGTPAVVALIDDLIYNTRLVPRIGFERTVFEDLMLLRAIACSTQALPEHPQAIKAQANEHHQELRDLNQLAEDIGALSPADSAAFQYWSDFTFELADYPQARKSA